LGSSVLHEHDCRDDSDYDESADDEDRRVQFLLLWAAAGAGCSVVVGNR